MAQTKYELAHRLRGCDLLTIPMHELGPLCQSLGVSGRGQKEELVERLYRVIWMRMYDKDDPRSGQPPKMPVSWRELNKVRMS